MPARAFGPRGPPPHMPGHCFNCLQMGHLRAQCPIGTTTPYSLNDVLLTSVDSSMGNKHDEIIIPHKAVDCSLADTTHSSACNTPLNKVSPNSVNSSMGIKQDGVSLQRRTLFHGLDWTRGLSWKQLLNNNPGIINFLQHWRHHY